MTMNPKAERISLKDMGLELLCHSCGEQLPLLHPHIMVERNDDDGNIICEGCWERERSETTRLG